ncbi:hypothetical protein DL93DRAFT_2095553 [Clavulina sp. PMI_390]|nr:hypothetical protein DL93DRAFT_2095553 [Clavulina sp. PMI_390]
MVAPLSTSALGIANSEDTWRSTGGDGSYWTQTAWNISIVVTDIVISGYLSYLMRKRRTGFRSTNSMTTLITLYGVTNGAVSSAVALVAFLGNQLVNVDMSINIALWSPPLMICVVLANALRALVPPDESIPMPSFSLHVLARAPRGRYAAPQVASQGIHRSTSTTLSSEETGTPRVPEPKAQDHDRIDSSNLSDSGGDETILIIESPCYPPSNSTGISCRKINPRSEEGPTTPTTEANPSIPTIVFTGPDLVP